jgi:PKD repeat protein
VPYSDATGKFTLVNNTVALPNSSGCDPGFPIPGGFFDSTIGLPSPDGNNTVIAAGHLSPILLRGVRAALRATPSSGLAPLTVSFDASGSHAVAGIASYALSFGDGTRTTDATPTMSHRYARPGVYLATLTITDRDGDADTTKLTVTVKKSCIVPPVIGKQLPAAQTAIRAASCTVGTITRRSSARPSGLVLAQSPVAGRKVAAGTAVALTVSRG